MIHADAHRQLAAGFVLEDLAPGERADYERHRRGCRSCAGLEAELDLVLADLALIAPEREPPRALLDQIIGAIGNARASRSRAPFGVDLAGSAVAMVTLEPEGGAVDEPGPQVVFGEI